MNDFAQDHTPGAADGGAPAPGTAETAVSPAEEALWRLEELAPGTPVNNVSVAFAVAGRVDAERLQAALAAVAERHQALRTGYRDAGSRLVKRVLAAAECPLVLEETELPGEPTPADLAPVTAAPFPLDGTPPVRAALFRSPDTDVVCVTAHRLVLDEISGPLLRDHLTAAYEENIGTVGTAETGPAAEAPSLAFWRTELAGANTDAQELSCTAPDPDRPTLAAAQLDRTLPASAEAGLRRLADDLGVPPSAILLAAYYVLLETHGAGPDLLVGLPVDLRPVPAARALGRYTGEVPLRLRTEHKESVRDLVLRSAERLAAATAHAAAAEAELAGLLPPAAPGRPPLPFRHTFEHRTVTCPAAFTFGGLDARPFPVTSGTARFDLHLTATAPQDPHGATALRLRYRTELFDPALAELLLARYETVLRAFTADPDRAVGDVSWWSGRDHEIIGAANDTAGPVEPATVLDAVRLQVRRAPDAVVVVDGERTVGYGQLWNAAHAMATRLKDIGVRPGDVVAIALPRGAELVAAVLGTWLAGAAYVPVDAAHPRERIRYQLSDSAATVLVADEHTAALAGPDGPAVLHAPPADHAPQVPATDAPVGDPAACAYLMYTSGSTGRPKGTLIGHAALANLAAHFAAQLAAAPGDTMLWTTTFAFDMSGVELFVPLVSGGRLVAAPDRARSDGRVLRELLERHDVRFVQATPTAWRLVADRAADRLRGRSVLIGGEPVPLPLARRLRAAGCELHHAYGPTETTIWSTSRVIDQDPGARLDVGRPIRNTRVHVSDAHGRDLPVGVRGELCISGTGVALGYHGRPELDAERFGVHPEYGRFYRTGDVACWRADGLIDLFGRIDRQVKLRGNRIELGEIEATLTAHPQVAAAAVIMVGDPSDDGVLIGCLEPSGDVLDTADVHEHARARLSRSMLPGDLVTVDPLPVNANGKVDLRELERIVTARRTAPGPTGTSPSDAAGRPGTAAGADALTDQLVQVWRTVLRRADADADTDFFAAGGHSMLAAVAMQEFQNLSGRSLGLSEIFEQSTPRQLAARIRATDTAAEGAPQS
ncbi:amino acid adenylation domain-containing protein [Streptomyces chrestomyceticus]|uniref:amino acid adenylation domain-containing protein n=1 Tax=Streptomyces chrestomyceticus TaxID=68185 RepID=UPI0037BC95E8